MSLPAFVQLLSEIEVSEAVLEIWVANFTLVILKLPLVTMVILATEGSSDF